LPAYAKVRHNFFLKDDDGYRSDGKEDDPIAGSGWKRFLGLGSATPRSLSRKWIFARWIVSLFCRFVAIIFLANPFYYQREVFFFFLTTGCGAEFGYLVRDSSTENTAMVSRLVEENNDLRRQVAALLREREVILILAQTLIRTSLKLFICSSVMVLHIERSCNGDLCINET
jgi:hypothetical protein